MSPDEERYGRSGSQPRPQMTRDEFIDYWDRTLADPQVASTCNLPESRRGADGKVYIEFGGELDATTLTEEQIRERNQLARRADEEKHLRAIAAARTWCPARCRNLHDTTSWAAHQIAEEVV